MTGKKEQAYKDYLDGMKYAEIAAKHDVSVSTVRSWAARYFKKENQNNLKHGAYRKVFSDTLGADEIELLDDIETDNKIVLEQTIITLTIRERRLLKEVKRLKEEDGDGKDNTDAIFNAARICESELTKIQAQKARLAMNLKKIRNGDNPAGDDRQINIMLYLPEKDEPG